MCMFSYFLWPCFMVHLTLNIWHFHIHLITKCFHINTTFFFFLWEGGEGGGGFNIKLSSSIIILNITIKFSHTFLLRSSIFVSLDKSTHGFLILVQIFISNWNILLFKWEIWCFFLCIFFTPGLTYLFLSNMVSFHTNFILI